MKYTSFNLRNALFALFLSAAAASTLHGAERIQNGGFETGSFPPWTFTDPSNFTNVGGDSAFAHSGTYHANLGASPNTGTLSQTFSTVAGSVYAISYYLANDGAAGGGFVNSFTASFNGVVIASVTQTNAAAFGYTLFTANVTATGASSTLQFQYRNDNDFFRLDDVSVQGNAPAGVPDHGATLWMALPAFAGLMLLHRKVRSATL